MKKMIFNVVPKQNHPVTAFIKAVNSNEARICIKFVNDAEVTQVCTEDLNASVTTIKIGSSKIGVYNLSNRVIDSIIDVINIEYTIISVDIDSVDVLQEECTATNICKKKEPQNKSSQEIENKPAKKAKPVTIEATLEKLLKSALDKLDKAKSIEEQAKVFLQEIDFEMEEKYEPVITRMFAVSTEFSRAITLTKIRDEVFNRSSLFERADVFSPQVQVFFKNWLAKYPDLKNKFPKIYLISLIKVFAKHSKK